MVAAVAVVGLLAGGCGGSGGSARASGPGASVGSGVPAGSSGSASPGASSSTSSGGGASTGFGWVPFGPTDPGDPPPNRWYGPLAEHDCSGLSQALTNEPGGALWDALDALCAAAIGGDESQWAVAATKAAAAGPRPRTPRPTRRPSA